MSGLLQIDKCGIAFGGIRAVHDFSLTLGHGELVAVIGPNGAGKTTLFNLLTGVYRPTSGGIRFEGNEIVGEPPWRINRLGIARTFQNIRLFADPTVAENVFIAFHQRIRHSLIAAALQAGAWRTEERAIRLRGEELLALFGLNGVRDHLAGGLSYGDQRRLEIVRALATGPRLLLLDEPAAGMNASEKQHLLELIRRVQRDYGVAILIIEHDMHLVMNLAPHIVVLDHGETIARGTPDEIRRDPRVIEAYLGAAPC